MLILVGHFVLLLCGINKLLKSISLSVSSMMIKPHIVSYLIMSQQREFTRFVTRLTRRVSLVEQKLLTLSEHMGSPPIFSGVRVARSLVFFVVFCRSLFAFLSFSLGH